MMGKWRPHNWALGYDEKEHTMLCMIKPTRAVYANASSGVSSVNWEPQRKRRRAKITIKRKTIYLGYFKNKEDAIKARIEGEKKYWNPPF